MTPEEYAKTHQKAFRCAFDYLNSHFPPEDDPAWWEKSAKELSEFSMASGENRLAIELLSGVFDYLEYIVKERRKVSG